MVYLEGWLGCADMLGGTSVLVACTAWRPCPATPASLQTWLAEGAISAKFDQLPWPGMQALAESCMHTDRHQRPSFESILGALDSMLAETAPAAC